MSTDSALSDVPAVFQDLLVLLPNHPPLQDGAWFGGVALRGMDGTPYLVAGRLLLASQGLEFPELPVGRIIDRPQSIVATMYLSEAQTLHVLQGFAQHEVAAPLQELLGPGVRLPVEKDAKNDWYAQTSGFNRHSRSLASRQVRRTSGGEVRRHVDKNVFDRADTALKLIDEPLQGLQEFVERLQFDSPNDFRHINGARCVLEVSAQLPLQVETFIYDTKAGGYRARIQVGAKLPLDRLKLSVTGPIKRVRALSHHDWKRVDGDESHSLVLEHIIPGEHKSQDLEWSFALDEEILGNGTCPKRNEADYFGSTHYPDSEQIIALPLGSWTFNPHRKLGSGGGSGEVFEGSDDSESALAIKRLKDEDPELSRREVMVARQLVHHKHRHIIPIFDAGIDKSTQRAFIVMPRAQQNLQQYVEASGATPESIALPILKDIVFGLEELGETIHRDLKPANILLHEDAWKLADLGTTRLSGAATATHTAKHFKTALYAAPEQWIGTRATKATDVYAFGCIIYALINGFPPFDGSDDDLYRKHTSEQPPPLAECSGPLKVLALRCLSKDPDSRPTLQDIRSQLALAEQPDIDDDPIIMATTRLAATASLKRIKDEQERKEQLARERSEVDAVRQMEELINATFQDIVRKAAGLASLVPQGVQFGEAQLVYRPLSFQLEGFLSDAGWDVRRGACISVFWRVPGEEQYRDVSANVWYARRPADPTFRWWEISFVEHSNIPNARTVPFGIEAQTLLSTAAAAIRNAPGRFLLKEGPIAADLESAQAFIQRWSRKLADAAQGNLEPG